MTKSARSARFVAALGCFAALLAANEAHAANPDCSTLPSPIHGAGGSATKPLLGKFAKLLAGTKTIVYQGQNGACAGYNALVGATAITGAASYWDATGKELTCNLTAVTGDQVVFANMGNSAALCNGGNPVASGFGDFLGPVQSVDVVVPKASTQSSISAAGAYFVWGFGAQGQASPWTDETQIIKRDTNSFVAQFIALATGVPVAKLKGVDAKSNGNTVTLLSNATDPEKAIGFVSGEVAEANASVVKPLAWQHFGQSCGYWPSSSQSSIDKVNVRTGQYWLWSPVHFFAAVDGAGAVTDAGAAELIGYVSEKLALPGGADLLDLEVAAGTVPRCAMEVWRDGDLATPYSYAPPEPCTCHYEAAIGGTSCQACANDAACPSTAPHCRYGYCEVN